MSKPASRSPCQPSARNTWLPFPETWGPVLEALRPTPTPALPMYPLLQLSAALDEVLRALPEQQRAALLLLNGQQRTQKDSAARLQLSAARLRAINHMLEQQLKFRRLAALRSLYEVRDQLYLHLPVVVALDPHGRCATLPQASIAEQWRMALRIWNAGKDREIFTMEMGEQQTLCDTVPIRVKEAVLLLHAEPRFWPAEELTRKAQVPLVALRGVPAQLAGVFITPGGQVGSLQWTRRHALRALTTALSAEGLTCWHSRELAHALGWILPERFGGLNSRHVGIALSFMSEHFKAHGASGYWELHLPPASSAQPRQPEANLTDTTCN